MIYVLVLVYALVRWGSGREIVIGLAVVLVAAVIGTVADYTGPADVIGGFGILAAAAADGAAFRYRAESWRRALDQIRSQERVGLARELHDMVAHHVSAIAVQAQAGRTLAGQRPEAALEALAVIEGEASRTLAEMRAMVRVLRDGAPAEYTPQPGVADLASLARREPSTTAEIETFINEVSTTSTNMAADSNSASRELCGPSGEASALVSSFMGPPTQRALAGPVRASPVVDDRTMYRLGRSAPIRCAQVLAGRGAGWTEH